MVLESFLHTEEIGLSHKMHLSRHSQLLNSIHDNIKLNRGRVKMKF